MVKITVTETGDWNCTHHASSLLLPRSRCTGIPRALCHTKLKRFGLRRKSPAASSCNEPHKAVDGNSHMATCVPESMTKTTVVLYPRVRKPFPGLRAQVVWRKTVISAYHPSLCHPPQFDELQRSIACCVTIGCAFLNQCTASCIIALRQSKLSCWFPKANEVDRPNLSNGVHKFV